MESQSWMKPVAFSGAQSTVLLKDLVIFLILLLHGLLRNLKGSELRKCPESKINKSLLITTTTKKTPSASYISVQC